jgi:outer membrane protein OmpA-like peptidoglycan-associated protein
MKKLIYLLVLLGLVAFSQPNYAQFNDWGTKFGFRGGMLFPENEFANFGFSGDNNTSFDWFKTSWLGEGFFAFELTNALELSLNAGYGRYAGLAYFDNKDEGFGEYQTTIIPLSLRIQVSPFELTGWNPYVYVGGGAMNFNVNTKPEPIVGNESTTENSWVGYFPAGVGVEIALSDMVLLDFSLGGALTTSYDLDAYKSANANAGDAYYNVSLGLSFVSENCEADKDMDGLGKCDEEKFGTDPKNPDTDADGLKDGEEVHTYLTNPLNPDTDGDGLKDGEEVSTYKTDPLIADSDKEGLKDGDEVLKYKTDPMKLDTDGDSLSDGDEVLQYKTDPLKADTDGDGLNDDKEVMTYKTDPLKLDTDGGTIGDGVEVKRGTDPLDPKDDVIKMNVPIVLEGITFATNKYEVTPESEKVLQGALKTLQVHKDIVVEISGHTDNVGSNAYNQKLSQRRADAVKAWLVSNGISADRITAVGYGEEHPRVSNDTENNRRLNRRIEFKRIK